MLLPVGGGGLEGFSVILVGVLGLDSGDLSLHELVVGRELALGLGGLGLLGRLGLLGGTLGGTLGGKCHDDFWLVGVVGGFLESSVFFLPGISAVADSSADEFRVRPPAQCRGPACRGRC